MDCECCGDRWHSAGNEFSVGSESPKINGKNPEDYNETWAKKGEVYCRVYYKNGKFVEYKKKDRSI